MKKIILSTLVIALFFNLKAQKTDQELASDLQLNTITTAVPFSLIAPD
jgi:hypothetical protein